MKNTAKLSLLLLLGAAQQNLEAKKNKTESVPAIKTLARGENRLTPGEKRSLPQILSGNGTRQPEKIIDYSLASSDVDDDEAVLKYETIDNSECSFGKVGCSHYFYEHTLSIPNGADSETFYVLEHNVNGDISVYSTVMIEKDSRPIKDSKKDSKKDKSLSEN